MSDKIKVSALIMTKDEELNIRACLESVRDVDEIIVVDSNSKDHTLEIVREFTDKIYKYEWDGKNPKKSWSLEVPKFSNDWILMLDADERLTDKFREELKKIVEDEGNEFSGYVVRYLYWFLGRFIRFGDPVKKLILFRKSRSHFEQYNIFGAKAIENLEVGHEHPIVEGKVGCMKSHILHIDTRPLYYFFQRHNCYSTWEAEIISRDLYSNDRKGKTVKLTPESLVCSRRLLKMIFLRLPFRSLLYFIYGYILRLGFLDGYPGLCYNICKSIYAYQIGLKVHELKIKEPT
jgi:glycosyltransferase involved in cell wall biosynthesis